MIRKNPSGHLPVIDESAYIDKTAIICGKVIIKENVFVGPYAVIRADEVDESGDMEPIVIGANSNIQDGVVIHSKSGAAVTIGEFSSIAHRSIVHGPAKWVTGSSSASTACCSTATSAKGPWCATTPWSMAAIFPGFMSLHHPHQPAERSGADPARHRGRHRVLRGCGSHQYRPGQGYKALSNEF